MHVIPFVLILAGAVLLWLILAHRWSVHRWLRAPRGHGRVVCGKNGRWHMQVQGSGDVTVVMESRLGGFAAEWWRVQALLAAQVRVVTYDRAGYGWSDQPTLPRSTEQIAHELREMLMAAGINGPLILVGHSQGALNVQHFARLYPQEVIGCVFLDPISHENGRFAAELPAHIYRSSGIDKSGGIRWMGWLCRLGLLPLFKPLLMQSPPFYYYGDMPSEAVAHIWRHHLRPATYRVVADEYRRAFTAANTAQLLAKPFPPVPVTVMYHSAAVIIAEIVQYGGLPEAEAQQVETLWEALTREYLALSAQHRWVTTDSSHMIHLDQPVLVAETVLEMVRAVQHTGVQQWRNDLEIA